jgi:hypothetical protein
LGLVKRIEFLDPAPSSDKTEGVTEALSGEQK